MSQHPRPLRLLAQYAAERIDQLISHEVAPRDLDDMTTYRLDNPDYLLEVIDGVLADPGFQDHWQQWRYYKRVVEKMACPPFERGQRAYHGVQSGEIENPAEGLVLQDDDRWLGMFLARQCEEDPYDQMWFYEGWLTALEEDEESAQKGNDHESL